jgi:acetamidase/formamidase
VSFQPHTHVSTIDLVPRSAVPEYMRTIFREVDRGPGAHILAGPIFVKGALPGDVLEVRIEAIDLAVDYGFNRQRPYSGTSPQEFPAWNQIPSATIEEVC